MNKTNNSKSNKDQTYQKNYGLKTSRNTSQMLDAETNKLYKKIDTDGAHSGYVLGYN